MPPHRNLPFVLLVACTLLVGGCGDHDRAQNHAPAGPSPGSVRQPGTGARPPSTAHFSISKQMEQLRAAVVCLTNAGLETTDTSGVDRVQLLVTDPSDTAMGQLVFYESKTDARAATEPLSPDDFTAQGKVRGNVFVQYAATDPEQPLSEEARRATVQCAAEAAAE